MFCRIRNFLFRPDAYEAMIYQLLSDGFCVSRWPVCREKKMWEQVGSVWLVTK